MMNFKKVLMLFLMIVTLWFSFIIFPQTYADLIDGIGLDKTQDEFDINYESYETDELDNDVLNQDKEANESDIYDDVELERESYQDLEHNDDLLDEQLLEDYHDDTDVEPLTTERHVVLVSTFSELQNAVNTAPVDGTVREIQVTADIVMSEQINVGGNRVIEIKSVSSDNVFTLSTQTGSFRFFLVEYGVSSSLTLENIILDGGNVGTQNGTSLTMNEGTIIRNNESPSVAGSVHVISGSSFVMNGGIIENNVNNGNGGGVRVQNPDSTFTMNDGIIRGNHAAASGGGVAVLSDSTFIMNGGIIEDNETSVPPAQPTLGFSGGGVRVQGADSTFIMSGGVIRRNTATANGGGLSLVDGSTFTMTGGSFIGNRAGFNGGGISTNRDTIATIQADSSVPIVIAENVASFRSTGGIGGGISGRNRSEIRMEGAIEVRGNRSIFGAGMAFRTFAQVELVDVNVVDNEAISAGGGIFVSSNADVSLVNTDIISNEAVLGGGIMVGDDVASLQTNYGRITENIALGLNSGGIFWTDIDILDRLIIPNTTMVYDNHTIASNSYRLFDNALKSDFKYHINPAPWNGDHDDHAFNEVDVRISGFSVELILRYNFTEDDEREFDRITSDDMCGNLFYAGNELTIALWNSCIINRDVPVRAGYTFGGWAFSPEGEIMTPDLINSGDFMFIFSSDFNLYAQWSPNQTRTITFNLNGGNVNGNQTNLEHDLRNGQSFSNNTYGATPIRELPTPIRAGYRFDGWVVTTGAIGANANPSVDDSFTTETVIESEATGITVTAQWEESSVRTITFRLDRRIPEGGNHSTPFLGASFDGYAGSVIIRQVYDGQTLAESSFDHTMPPAVVRPGYTHTGWHIYVSPDGVGGWFNPSGTAIIGDIELIPIATPNPPRMITFLQGGGSVTPPAVRMVLNGQTIANNTHNPNNPQVSLPIATRPDYTFVGWQVASYVGSGHLGNEVVVGAEFTENTTIYISGSNVSVSPQWAPIIRTITFDLDGGNIDDAVEDVTRKVRNGQSIFNSTIPPVNNTMPKPTREGFVFAGWQVTNSEATGILEGVIFTSNALLNRVITNGNVEVRARWKYTVTFATHDGEAVTTQLVSHGDFVTRPADPTLDRHYFYDWYTTQTGDELFIFDAPITANTTIHAQWGGVISFDSNNPDVDDMPFVMDLTRNGQRIIDPMTPTRAGYQFVGWYTAPIDGFRAVFPHTVCGNQTFYARWNMVDHTVTFITHGGTIVADQTVSHGEFATRPANPTRSNHHFMDWFTERDGTTTFDFNTPIVANTKVYAGWGGVITYNVHGGNEIPNSAVTRNNTRLTLPIPTRSGYRFDGWFASGTGAGSSLGSSLVVNGNRTIHARWASISQRTVTFRWAHDQSMIGTPMTISHGQSITSSGKAMPLTTLPPGYTFINWQTAITGGDIFDANTIIFEDMYVYAHRSENETRTITFDLNGGNIGGAVGNVTRTIRNGQTIANSSLDNTMPENPTKASYTFTGWQVTQRPGNHPENTPKVGAEFTENTTINATANVIVTAQWEEAVVRRRITFRLDRRITEGATSSAPFLGASFVGYAGSEIIHQVYDGQTLATSPFDDIIPGVVRLGYVFTGWHVYVSPDGVLPNAGEFFNPVSSAITGGDIEVIPIATPNPFRTILLDPGVNGIVTVPPAARSVLNGQTIANNTHSPLVNLPIATKPNYAFVGWQVTAINGIGFPGNEAVVGAEFTENTTIYISGPTIRVTAQWEPVIRTITFDLNGGNIDGDVEDVTREMRNGQSIFNSTIPPVNNTMPKPILEGVEFVDWKVTNSEATGILEGDIFTSNALLTRVITNGNVEVRARWKHTVTFATHDGEAVTTQLVSHGDFVTRPADPTLDRHYFYDWYTTQTGDELFIFDAPITANTTIHAQWGGVISFDSNNPDVDDMPFVMDLTRNGQRIIDPMTPTRAGYQFVGWYTAPIDGFRAVFPHTVCGNQTFYARWNMVDHTVTFITHGGTVVADQIVSHGELATRPANPTRSDHHFMDWFTECDGTTTFDFNTPIVANTKVYAGWGGVITYNVHGGNEIPNSAVTRNNTKLTLPIPTRTGYRFDGWFASDTGVGLSLGSSLVVYGNQTIYARWASISQHTITFRWAHDQSMIGTPMTISHGQSITSSGKAMPLTTLPPGYTFINWQTAITGGDIFDANTIIFEDMYVYAHRSENETRTITFDLNGGNSAGAIDNIIREMRDGQSISNSTVIPINNDMPEQPIRDGFIFEDWKVISSDAIEILEGDTFTSDALLIQMITGGNIVVRAIWQANPTYLNVSIPTSVMFQSNHINPQDLESQRFTIRNNSIVGVHVDVANFTTRDDADAGINWIEELNIQEVAIGATPTRLIVDREVAKIPTNSRLLALSALATGSFEFRGSSNITSETEVKNPSFNLLLRFEVTDVPSPFVTSN